MNDEIVITEMQLPVQYMENSDVENDNLTAQMDALLELYLAEQEQTYRSKRRRLMLNKIKFEEYQSYNRQVNLFIAS